MPLIFGGNKIIVNTENRTIVNAWSYVHADEFSLFRAAGVARYFANETLPRRSGLARARARTRAGPGMTRPSAS